MCNSIVGRIREDCANCLMVAAPDHGAELVVALGILCLETYWSDDPEDRRTSVPLLEVLTDNVPGVVADHRHVSTKADVAGYLSGLWRDPRYDVLMIAAHGRAGSLVDQFNRRITFKQLTALLKGSCPSRVVYLAGCETMAPSKEDQSAFFTKTGAAALIGYRKSVDWLEAAQMDFITLAALASNGPDYMGSWDYDPTAILADVMKGHEAFAKRIGWRYTPTRTTAKIRADAKMQRRNRPDGIRTVLEGLSSLAIWGGIDDKAQQSAADALRALDTAGAASFLAEVALDPLYGRTWREGAIRILSELDSDGARSQFAEIVHRRWGTRDDRDATRIRGLATRLWTARSASQEARARSADPASGDQST